MKIYSSQDCNHCVELKQQLIDKGVDFELYDIEDDFIKDEAVRLCEETGNTELPVVVKNGRIYNRPSLEEIV